MRRAALPGWLRINKKKRGDNLDDDVHAFTRPRFSTPLCSIVWGDLTPRFCSGIFKRDSENKNIVSFARTAQFSSTTSLLILRTMCLRRGIFFSRGWFLFKRMGLIFLRIFYVRFFSLKFDTPFLYLLLSTVSFKTAKSFPPIRIIYRELIKFVSLGFQVELNTFMKLCYIKLFKLNESN